MFLKKFIPLFMLCVLSAGVAFASPAVLIEENPPEQQSTTVESAKKSEAWVSREKPISEGKSLAQIYADQDFESSLSLREQRRVGVGGSLVGSQGMIGALVELNLEAQDSALVGIGGGSGYNSFGFHWKHHLSGRFLTPYTTLGYSKWVNSGSGNSNIEDSKPSYLASRFLTTEEKRSGKFSKDVFSGSLGIQFYQLEGPTAGLSFFAEIAFLVEAADLSPVPSAGIGSLFYF